MVPDYLSPCAWLTDSILRVTYLQREVGKGKGVKGCAARSARGVCVCVCVLRKLRRGAEWVVPNYLLTPSTHPLCLQT